MDDQKKERGKNWRFLYLLPNLVTGLGLMVGLFVLFDVAFVEGKVGDEQLVLGMIGLLLVAGVADLCDGALARALRAQTRFGLVFDSMSDAVSFGIAPALLSLKTVDFSGINPKLALGCALFYALCGILRLTRYASSFEPVRAERVNKQENPRTFSPRLFVGLPIPGACSALVSLNLFLLSMPEGTLSQEVTVFVALSALIFLGLLMVSRWYFPPLSLGLALYPLFRLSNSKTASRIYRFLRPFKEHSVNKFLEQKRAWNWLEFSSKKYLFSSQMFFVTPLIIFVILVIFSLAKEFIVLARDFTYSLSLVFMTLTWGYVLLGIAYALALYCFGDLERARAPKTALEKDLN